MYVVHQDIPKEMDGWPWWEVKWNLTSQYKFNIAIENSISYDYVTEKLFHSFIVGSVPSKLHLHSLLYACSLFLLTLVISILWPPAVYLGAPNVDDFAPSTKSIIKVTDFEYLASSLSLSSSVLACRI